MLITKVVRNVFAIVMLLAGYCIYNSFLSGLLLMVIYMASYFLGALSLKYEIENKDK